MFRACYLRVDKGPQAFEKPYLEGQGGLVSRLIMGITGVTICGYQPTY